MRVFKFGGASVKDANGVQNLTNILKSFPKDEIIVVVSAMGKTTNHLEQLVHSFYHKENPVSLLDKIKKYHFTILEELFKNKNHPIYDDIHNTFVELEWAIEGQVTQSYDYEYDQIVCMGEIIATKIVSAYLNEEGIKNKWWDVRDFIHTDNCYREGKVNWQQTQKCIEKQLVPFFQSGKEKIVITQGFIGSTSENYTTTLGREGSDYTAAILAYAVEARDVTIWKDVAGVLNADPKWFDETKLIEQLSYQDAIELSYYGATIIHPKTIKPLQNKKIPLYVKSFLAPTEKGTVINDNKCPLPIPSFIFKIDQVLISVSPKDFSFIAEENLSDIFKSFSEYQVKINLMQNSAISFSICADNDVKKITPLISTLQKSYRVLYNEYLELITIRYYDQSTIDRVCVNKKILLEQKSRYTVQLVVKSN